MTHCNEQLPIKLMEQRGILYDTLKPPVPSEWRIRDFYVSGLVFVLFWLIGFLLLLMLLLLLLFVCLLAYFVLFCFVLWDGGGCNRDEGWIWETQK